MKLKEYIQQEVKKQLLKEERVSPGSYGDMTVETNFNVTIKGKTASMLSIVLFTNIGQIRKFGDYYGSNHIDDGFLEFSKDKKSL